MVGLKKVKGKRREELQKAGSRQQAGLEQALSS